jgi:hypothetical protein
MKPLSPNWWVVALLGVREKRNGNQSQIKKLDYYRHPLGWRFFLFAVGLPSPQGLGIAGPLLEMGILLKFMQFSKSFPRLEGVFQA